MAGTKVGAQKAKVSNLSRHGNDFYSRIGAIGGRVKGVKKGFAANPERARRAGQIGGAKSTRGKKITDEKVDEIVRLWEQDTPLTVISEEVGLNYRTVRAIVENYLGVDENTLD